MKKKHAEYKTCPECGAHLDPQEHCDCENAEEKGEVKMSDNTVNRLSVSEAYALIEGLTEEEKKKLLAYLEKLIRERDK